MTFNPLLLVAGAANPELSYSGSYTDVLFGVAVPIVDYLLFVLRPRRAEVRGKIRLRGCDQLKSMVKLAAKALPKDKYNIFTFDYGDIKRTISVGCSGESRLVARAAKGSHYQ